MEVEWRKGRGSLYELVICIGSWDDLFLKWNLIWIPEGEYYMF